jgi:glucose-1-phosphate adenylyltransferase
MVRRAHKVLAIVMAGGRGDRLKPLTSVRSKPAVPFGGRYRIVDFVLSNLSNSGIDAIYVLTQYKAQSLLKHISRAWPQTHQANAFVEVVPAQMQSGEQWYRGTADAVSQNLDMVREFAPDYVAVFGADHIYKMDVSQMLDFHIERGADATVACLPVPLAEAAGFGVAEVDSKLRIQRFHEKVKSPPTIPGHPDEVFASMGNYVFGAKALFDILAESQKLEGQHDFGTHVIPRIVAERQVFAYDFRSNAIALPGGKLESHYWRDVGTLDAYFDANMDLRNVLPQLNLYNWQWPIRTASFNDPPAKFVFDEDTRRGHALMSIVSGGCIVSGARVKDSVLGRNVFVHTGADVEQSILFDNVDVGRHCKIRRAIIDKNVRLTPGTVIGYDAEADRKRWFVSESGIVVIDKAPETEWSMQLNR